MPDDLQDTHCHGCGRPSAACRDAPCGRAGDDDPAQFCRRCGWRLRDIAVVPGLAGRWCRRHGVQS
ncbi:MAG TPA: hypothetical protein VM933_10620 [Acidimicrobiales bacterium]|nr:hypothetical protein [Acidimicrobiales bacterium]